MTNLSRIAWITGAIALLLIPTLLVAAGPGWAGGGEGRFGGFEFADRLAQRLDLTEQQRRDIRDILVSHRDEIEPAIDALRTARSGLRDTIHAEIVDEAAIRDASAVVAEAEADLAVLRGTIVQDVRTVLTPEQQAEAQQIREDLEALVGFKLEHFRQRIDQWIGG